MHGFYSRAELEQIGNEILGQRLPGRPKQDPFVQSVTQNYKIGSRLRTPGGLTWHYCQNGPNNIVAPYWDRGMCSLVDKETFDTPTGLVSTAPAGSYTVVIPDTNTDHGADYWANGKAEFWGTYPACAQHRKIKSSTPSDGSSVTLTLYHPLTVTLAADTGVEICRSVYASVDQPTLAASPLFKSIACVPHMLLTANYYFWGLTWGECTIAVTSDLGLVGGQRLITFNPADGTIRPYVAGEQIAGYLVPDTAGGAETIIMLQLDP